MSYSVKVSNLKLSVPECVQEARNIEDFYENFKNDPTVKIPLVYKNLCGRNVLVMEWIDGIRCTDPQVTIHQRSSESSCGWHIVLAPFFSLEKIKEEEEKSFLEPVPSVGVFFVFSGG